MMTSDPAVISGGLRGTSEVAIILATESPTLASEVIETSAGVIGAAWLVPVLPLLGFVAILALTRYLGDRAAHIATAVSGVVFVLAIAIAVQVLGSPASYLRPMPTWIEVGGLTVTFDLLVDQLSTVMLLVVTGVGFLIHVYSVGYMHGDPRYTWIWWSPASAS